MSPPKKKNSATKPGSEQNSRCNESLQKRKAPTKKKMARKQKTSEINKAIVVAFITGIVFTSACFWFLGDVLPVQVSGTETKTAAQSTASVAIDSTPTERFEERDRSPAQDGALPQVDFNSSINGSTGKPTPETQRSPSLSLPGKISSSKHEDAVVSAIHDLTGLAFEEDHSRMPLQERLIQVDYAIMQAAGMAKLPLDALQIVHVEEEQAEGVPYKFQQIEILTSDTGVEFTEVLESSLSLWVNNSRLEDSGDGLLEIYIGDVSTHEIRFIPKEEAAYPQRSTANPASAEASPQTPLSERVAPGQNKTAQPKSPKLVIVIDDLGASSKAVRELLNLEYPVTFAFWPHGEFTRKGALEAHGSGHEILIHQPMEPIGYPGVKPGPNALLSGMKEDEIQRILEKSIMAVPHAVGLNNHMGSRFTQQVSGVDAVLRFLGKNNLFMLDSLTHHKSIFARRGKELGIEHYRRNVFLDVNYSKSSVLEELRRAERIALLTGEAVAIGHPLPGTLAALKEWQQLRNKDIQIVRLRELSQR